MPLPVYPEKMKYLDEVKGPLREATEPKVYRSQQQLVIDWLGGSSGRTRIRDVELVCDERAESTGFGAGVSPAHTFLAGFGFSHMTQWGRAAVLCGVEIDSLREEVSGSFDRRGEYLYEEGYEHQGFTEITFEVHIESGASREQVREFIASADRSPPHATLRRAVRLVGIFHLNGRHLATAIYHPDRTEWRGYP
jgi:uncharacterized OsmC-like protein